jgi:hypothetical protein
MPEQPHLQNFRSQDLFRAAPDDVKNLVKKIMAKERLEQHKKNRQSIYQDLLTFIRESVS